MCDVRAVDTSPLVGEVGRAERGREGGKSPTVVAAATPRPNPPPQEGRERARRVSAIWPIRLSVISILLAIASPVLAQPASFTPREETPEEFPAGPGRDETFYTCTACHNFKLVAAQGMSRERWEDTLDWMTVRHGMPKLEGEDRRRVVDYLAKTYPAAAAPRGGWKNPFQ